MKFLKFCIYVGIAIGVGMVAVSILSDYVILNTIVQIIGE